MIRDPRVALVILTLMNLFNYIDRCVLSAVQPKIKADLGLSDGELGLLTSAFIWVYMLTSPVFGRLGDTGSRRGLIGLGVGIWSLATALGGLARSFTQLFFARAAVGVGEAAYGTLSPAFIADSFHKSMRGRVFAFFFAAMPIGYALGYVIGGMVSGPESDVQGWRRAFFVAGLPGLLLAAAAFLLKEPARGAHDDPEEAAQAAAAKAGPPEGPIAAYISLLKIRSYTLTVLGYAAYTFAVGGLAVWMPTFLNRVRGEPLDEANQLFGGITLAAGFIGTLGGGWLGDRMVARGVKNAYLMLSAISTLLAFPALVLALTLPTKGGYYGAAFAAELLIFASTSPINSVVVNVVPVAKRASATALCIFLIHALGDAISPPIIGFLSDFLGRTVAAPGSAEAVASSARALSEAVLVVPAAIFVSAAIWFWAALGSDTKALDPTVPAVDATPGATA